MNLFEQIHALDRALTSDRSLDAIAAEFAVPREQLVAWRTVTEAARAAGRQRRRRRWAGALAVALCLLTTRTVLAAGTCAQTLPAPLATLCANEPALADEVNGNFSQLVAWVQQKVGPVGSPDITTANVAANSLAANSVLKVGPLSATNSGLQVSWNRSGNIGETSFVNLKGLGAGGFNFANGSTTSALTQLASIAADGKLRVTNGVSGIGRLCIAATSCTEESAFTCGGFGQCSAGKVMVGVRDGTGCGTTNTVICCTLSLADNCP